MRHARRSRHTVGPTTVRDTTRGAHDVDVLRAAMRRAAEVTSDELPILSVYVDLRPEAHGERPYARAELVPVRDRLADVVRAAPAHSAARRSLEADRDRLWRLVDDEGMVDVEGLALIASHGLGVWEAIATAQPIATDLAAGPIADLYPLAHVTDDSGGVVVVLADSHDTRLFIWRRGTLREHPGPHEGSEEHQRHDQGGAAQARFQRHVDEQDRRFARTAAGAIDRLAQAQRAGAIVICAEERASSTLVPALSERSRSLVADVRRMSVHAGRDEVEAEVGPLLWALRDERSADVAARAVAGARAGDLGAVGGDAVARLLRAGAVDQLVFDAEAARSLDRWERASLVRDAVLTDASIVVADHGELRRAGGVGAVLRYRPDGGRGTIT